MAGRKGFSLIETLIAVSIASLSVLALMNVVSQGTTASMHALDRFDTSLQSAVLADEIDETLSGMSIEPRDLFIRRFQINHTEVANSLSTETYSVKAIQKTIIDPLAGIDLRGYYQGASLVNSMRIYKVFLSDGHQTRVFYKIVPPTK